VVKYDRRADYIYTALFACLSFGTKDQGYAIFVIPFVVYLALLPVLSRKAGETAGFVLFRKNILVFALCMVLFTLLVENVFLNYEGLAARFQYLTGEGGKRSIGYAFDVTGMAALAASLILFK